MNHPPELTVALALAAAAGGEVLKIYHAGTAAERKADGSPITAADRLADRLIVAGLRAAFPHDAILSEESAFVSGGGDRVWMVDPIDGTADFVAGTDDFAVMIGLCKAGEPVLGVVMAPALGRTWAGAVGVPTFELIDGQAHPLVLSAPVEPLRVLISRSHPAPEVQAVLDRLGARATPRGGVGVKVGLILSGEADAYYHPRPGTYLWDLAAPAAMLKAAGGLLLRADGQPPVYDPRYTANPQGVLAAHPRACASICEAAGTPYLHSAFQG